MVEDDETRRTGELYRVHAWRFTRAEKLGYSIARAEEIASSDADIHELEHLIVDLHCPLRLARKILV